MESHSVHGAHHALIAIPFGTHYLQQLGTAPHISLPENGHLFPETVLVFDYSV